MSQRSDAAPDSRPRVVVTGIGPVTPVGTGVDAFWSGLVEGRNGIGPIERFDTSDLPVKLAGEVRDFAPTDWMEVKEARHTDRFVHFAVAASQLAHEDAGKPDLDRERTGVVIATGVGGLESLLTAYEVMRTRGPGRVSPFMVPSLMANAAAGQVAMRFGVTGPNFAVVTACAAGAHAVGEAYRMIREGLADVVLAGGSEGAIMPLTVAAFAQMQALTRNPDPETASRPFDAHRDGFVLGEGACVLVLERADLAEARRARVYAEVAGYGASADAYHITQPEPSGSGAALALTRALADAGEPPEAVGYINAHGTSTPLNDAAETAAIKAAFGEEIAHEVPISSTKSMTGHMTGAAGAVEAAAAALAVSEGVLPPTIHYRTPDPACDLDYVPNEARKADVRLALSNSFGFGGQNAVLAFRRPG
ncbi:MAG: beta-ketoacyl-ACP synthase II [Actinomycetota bacterium]|nr:beta-ketoacyl-ACP synthase II [Actinomycetota bacterium]